MYELELWERAGADAVKLGMLQLVEVCHDQKSGAASLEVRGYGGQVLATVQVEKATVSTRPWRAVLAALTKLYGHQTTAPRLRHDGRCNGLTQKGRRCRLEAEAGRYYCRAHDPLREPPTQVKIPAPAQS